jgi:hypothetical protein
MNSVLIKRLKITLLALGLSATTAPPTFAGVALNTIDPSALVTNNGRHIMVSGPIACTAGERVTLRVTVTQRTTGAVAHGRTRFTCAGDLQQWEVHVVNHSTTPFEEGVATAVARARTTAQGEPTDAHQWLVEVMLVG